MLFGPGEHRVLRRDVDDVAAHGLLDQHRRRRLRDQERALGHDVVLEVPVLLGGLEQRLRERDSGVVDDDVDAAEGEHRLPDGRRDLLGRGDVHGHADRDIRGSRARPRPPATSPGRGRRSRRRRRRRRAGSRWPCRFRMPRRSPARPASRATWAWASAAAWPPRAPSTRCGTSPRRRWGSSSRSPRRRA